jgi:diguanylate cyclase (GGDEF)-like protein/PAS domain S-box-containing protein
VVISSALTLPYHPDGEDALRRATRPFKLRRHILLPASLALAMMMGLFLYGAGRYLHGIEMRRTQSAAEMAQTMWGSLQAQQTQRLSWFVGAAQEEDKLIKAMVQGDRDRLLELTENRLASLNREFGISHWYFMTPDRRVLLRVHAPGRRGDVINRKSMLDAAMSGKPATGLELGTMGTFTLRHVAPWRVDGRLIGYMEMGSDVDWFASEIKRLINQDLVLAVNKRFTTENSFNQGKRALGLTGNWGDDPELAVLRQTIKSLPDTLLPGWRRLLGQPGITQMDAVEDEHLWSVAVRPISDSEGRDVASLAVLREVGVERAADARQLMLLGVGSGTVGLLVLAILFWRVRMAESRMRRADTALRLAASAFEIQDGMMVTDGSGFILQVNRAFSDITGYAAEDVIGQPAEMLRAPNRDDSLFQSLTDTLMEVGKWQGEVMSRRKSGEVYPQRLSLTLVKSGKGHATHCVAAFSDITERKVAEAQIERLAYYDPLTGLPNRRLLMDRLTHALATSRRSQCVGALLLIDLDHFKTLNDTLGHDQGDVLLQQLTQRMQPCLRQSDTLARLGGDEFVLVLEGLSEDMAEAATQARAVGEKLLGVMAKPFELAGTEYHSTCSIGLTMFCGHIELGLDELMKQADLAMYAGKAAGRNTLRFFDPQTQEAVTRRAMLESDLRKGLQRQEFELYYQPQVGEHGHVYGAEALVRWRHLERGMVSPAEFIPAAEQTGLILPLGQWVMEAACRQLVTWAPVPALSHLTVAVNVSVCQFRQPDFVEQVLSVLDSTGANPMLLKLELTESLLVDDMESVISKMTALQSRGVSFSLDDFGTGYSSLNYLKRLPLNQLKIDQSFVRNVMSDSNDAAIVRTIVALAESLGLTVIAEGVETLFQRDFLVSHGCMAFQGYLFGRPVPVQEFEQVVLG